jgi:hypothetical protein
MSNEFIASAPAVMALFWGFVRKNSWSSCKSEKHNSSTKKELFQTSLDPFPSIGCQRSVKLLKCERTVQKSGEKGLTNQLPQSIP